MAQSNKRVTKESESTDTGEKPQHAYFVSLELENVRCFKEKQKIDFSDSDGNWKRWTIILGDNGTGKTTMLQVLVYNFVTIKFVNYSTVRETGLVRFNPHKIKHFRKSFNLFSQTFPKVYKEVSFEEIKGSLKLSLSIESNFTRSLFGYGASRKAGESSISEENEELPLITLFDEKAFLLNPEEWLLQAHYATTRESDSQEKRKKELEQVKDILKKVLPDVDEIRFGEKELEGKRIPQPIVEFHTPYGWVEAKDLSLGYRTSMAWVVDFASRMFDTYQESENPLAEPAVCLVDEIDLHLHPRWQREMIDYLSNLFPNTQFIVTTHSPLIVQAAAARDANFVVCKREGDHVVIDQSIEAVRGWRTDQLLTSDLFGLESSRDIEIEKLEKEQRKILSKAKLTKAESKRAKEISAQLNSLRVMENPEDDEAMEIIRESAKYLKNNGRK